MPVSTEASPLEGPFVTDPDMPSFALNEFDLFESDDSYPASHPGLMDISRGNPLGHFADPKALMTSETTQVDPTTKTPAYTSSSPRGSSSSASSRRSADSSVKTSHTSTDTMMLDDNEGPWETDHIGALNEPSNFDVMYTESEPLDLSHVFDFESASSSPTQSSNHVRSTMASPEFSSAAPRSPRAKRHKGVRSQTSVTRSMDGPNTSVSRETSPTTNPSLSHVSSPTALFQNSPPPENHINFFHSLSGVGVAPVWPNMPELQNGAQITPTQFRPNISSFTPLQNQMAPPYVPQRMPGGPPPRLFVQPTPLKSRVETQIPIKLTIHHLPSGIKRIHLPVHTISKPKLLSRPPAVRAPDMLELYTMLVCTSAMADPAKRDRALARAAAARHDYRAPRAQSQEVEDDENLPQNGGEVRICAGCITRERKRASRKKNRKPEEEELWNRFEHERAIVFNTQEVKEWQPVTAHMADPTGAGLRESVPEGTMQVDVPMRIACYCRHHGEKSGFQVIFTVKDYLDNVVAQQLSSSIMITDDHKTNFTAPPSIPNSTTTSNPVPSTSSTATSADMKHIKPPIPFQQLPNADSRNPANNGPFAFRHGAPFAAPDLCPPANNAPVNTVPKPASHQSSPTFQTAQQPAQVGRKRKASVSGKVPNDLAMTKIEHQASSVPNVVQPGPSTTSAAPSPFSPPNGTFPLTAEALLSHGEQPILNNSPQPFSTGPPTPCSGNGTEQMMFPLNRALSIDNMPPQLFSAPPTTNPSRAPSPSQLREVSRGLYGPNAGASPARAPQPMIYKIIPNEGPKSGGVEVTILGSGFTNDGLEVMFGENRAATTTFWGETSLVCLLPPCPHAGIVPVSIRQPSAPTPFMPQGNQQPLFRYVDDDEHRLIRTALTVLGHKLGGKITDVADIARNILYGPATGGSWNSSGSGPGQAPGNGGGNNYNGHQQESDAEAGLLRVLELIDLDDSPNKARINLRRSSGQTMLHLACSLGMVRLVAGLLSRGANVGLRDKGGFTALHMAAMNDQPEIVRRLIMKGADPTMRSLSGLTSADVARSSDVIRILRRIESHARSRSGGSSHHSRVNSASSLRSLWDPPSMTPVQRDEYQETSEEDPDETSVDSDEEERDYIEMMNPSASRFGLEVPNPRAMVQPGIVLPGVAAMTAVRDHFTTQIQQLQQSMAMQFQNLSNMQSVLPDAQAYLQSPSVVQRISNLVPNIRGAGEQSPADSRWSFFGAKEATPPPAYEEIYPQKDLDTKQASAAQAAADFEADSKCAALFDHDVTEVSAGPSTEMTTETTAVETSAEVTVSGKVPELLHVGRKKTMTREQQETLQRAHAAKLKTISRDRMLWFFWLPILVCILTTMVVRIAPSFVSFAVQTVPQVVGKIWPEGVAGAANERIVEVA